MNRSATLNFRQTFQIVAHNHTGTLKLNKAFMRHQCFGTLSRLKEKEYRAIERIKSTYLTKAHGLNDGCLNTFSYRIESSVMHLMHFLSTIIPYLQVPELI